MWAKILTSDYSRNRHTRDIERYRIVRAYVLEGIRDWRKGLQQQTRYRSTYYTSDLVGQSVTNVKWYKSAYAVKDSDKRLQQ